MLPLLVYDTETASLQGGVVEFAAILYHQQDVYEVRLLGNPGRPIDPNASRVHGYTDADVEGLPLMEDLLNEWWKDVTDLVGTQMVLCGHNTNFDYRMVRPHIPLPDEYQLCTLRSARQLWNDAPNHKLSTLIEFLGLNQDREFHTALDDVKATIDLLQHITATTGKGYMDLAKEQSVPQRLAKMPFGKHKGQSFKDIPSSYFNYMLGLPDLSRDVKYTMQQELASRAYG